jgi:hypothetical protein
VHALGRRKRLAEQREQLASQGLGPPRRLHGLLDLPEDLRFAENQRIEARGDAEHVQQRAHAAVGVQLVRARVGEHQPLDVGLRRRRIRRGHQHLGAVAGREQEGLADGRRRQQAGQARLQLDRLHGVALAHLEACAAVRQTHQQQARIEAQFTQWKLLGSSE